MERVTVKDNYGRIIYDIDSNGFWTALDYNKPKEGQNPLTMTPKRVTHKYSYLYK